MTRPGLQDSGERETWKVLTTSSLQLIHLDVGDTISLVADELGYSLQYLLFCIKLEAARY